MIQCDEGGIFSNSPSFLTTLGTLYQEKDIKPEFEVFDMGMIGPGESTLLRYSQLR